LGIFIYETLMSLRHTKVTRNLKLETGGKAENEINETNEINQIFG
jgi:hypothetical protein